jgi:hypothetical protein
MHDNRGLRENAVRRLGRHDSRAALAYYGIQARQQSRLALQEVHDGRARCRAASDPGELDWGYN